MKVAIGMKLRSGPFGGGNQFGNALKDYLEKQGVEVVDHLNDNDIDVIMLTDPRTFLLSSAFSPSEIISYLKKKPDTIITHRINESGEHRGSKTLNKILAAGNSICDHTIYISEWVKNVFVDKGFKLTENFAIVLNGGDNHIFNNNDEIDFNSHDKQLKIVTHHWSSSWLKGWDIYLLLDKLLDNEKYKNKIQFKYIGRMPNDVLYNNIISEDPLSGKELASKLRENDIYLTASKNEVAGMHHIEGALCGLPIIYMKSGGIPEYCEGFGVEFNGVDDFENA